MSTQRTLIFLSIEIRERMYIIVIHYRERMYIVVIHYLLRAVALT